MLVVSHARSTKLQMSCGETIEWNNSFFFVCLFVYVDSSWIMENMFKVVLRSINHFYYYFLFGFRNYGYSTLPKQNLSPNFEKKTVFLNCNFPI